MPAAAGQAQRRSDPLLVLVAPSPYEEAARDVPPAAPRLPPPEDGGAGPPVAVSDRAGRLRTQIATLQRDLAELQRELAASGGERWRLHRVLGAGSYGVVAAGRDVETGERVAVKKVKRDVWDYPLDARRIHREVQVMTHLHWSSLGAAAAHFVAMLDIVVPPAGGGAFWVVMDLADGDLRHVLMSDQPLTD
eukprot:gene26701-27561_t